MFGRVTLVCDNNCILFRAGLVCVLQNFACNYIYVFSPSRGHVLSEWWGGHQHFQYGSDDNNLTLVASYTQMAWYNSHQVGCGFAQCSTTGGAPFFRYVCNYCPAWVVFWMWCCRPMQFFMNCWIFPYESVDYTVYYILDVSSLFLTVNIPHFLYVNFHGQS